MPINLDEYGKDGRGGDYNRKFTLEQTIEILTLLAKNNGNIKRTREEYIEDTGTEVGETTIRRWMSREFEQEYINIREKHKTEYEAEAVRNIRDRIRQADELENQLLEFVANNMAGMSGHQAAQSAFNVSRVKKDNIEKLLLMTGRPGQIIEKRTIEDAVRALEAKKILKPTVQEADDD